MKNLLVLSVALVCSLFFTINVEAQTTNGENVQFVQYGPAEKPQGSFVLRKGKSWIEKGATTDIVIARFREVNRDEWSVYLRDDSRSMNIQLDLHTRKIMISHDGKNDRRELYKISKSLQKPNGLSTTRVFCTNGSRFVQISATKWKEMNSKSKRVATFEEVGRDEWSVFLKDDSRSMNIQLDMHQMKVMISHYGKNDTRVLYNIDRGVQ